MISQANSDSDSDCDDSDTPETRGRKEIELEEYRLHVSSENKKNDDEIDRLKVAKQNTRTKKTVKSLATQIAKVQREKTTRCRRLRDRERFNI